MEKHVLWVICFLLLTHIAEGQQVLRKDSVRQRDSADIVPARVVSAPANDISNVFPLDKKVAGYTPVTPSASRLMNEINHPVDYGTGAVDVSIPIHTIRTRDFTLPIVLRCKMTGIKASETNYSWVGIGWNLEAEPTITRQVRGKNDEDYYVNYDSRYDSSDLADLVAMMKGYFDTTPDVFYYKTLSGSGKFVFKRPESQAESGRYVPMFFPETAHTVSVSGKLEGISMTDPSGNVYNFNAGIERTYSPAGYFVTAWKPSSITSLQGETMTFRYAALTSYKGMYDYSFFYDFYAVEDNDSQRTTETIPTNGYWRGCSGVLDYYVSRGIDPTTKEYYDFEMTAAVSRSHYDSPVPTLYPTVLQRISYAGGRIEFMTDDMLLKQIKVYEGSECIKTVDFTYGTFNHNSLKPKLTELSINGENYLFAYEEPNTSHTGFEKNLDYWGFFNSHTENKDLVPRQKIELGRVGSPTEYGSTYIGGANREPSLTYAQMYSLKEMVYPNGTKDIFYRQLNRYVGDGVSTPTDAGGLRISMISSYDTKNNNTWLRNREFTYGSNGAGSIWMPPLLCLFQEDRIKRYIHYTYTNNRRYRIYSSHSSMNLFHGDATVLYDKVTETVSDIHGVTKKTEYLYTHGIAFSMRPTAPVTLVPNLLDEWKVSQLSYVNEYDPETSELKKKSRYAKSCPFASDLVSQQIREGYERSICIFSGVSEKDSHHLIETLVYTLRDGEGWLPTLQSETLYDGEKEIVSAVEYSYGNTKREIGVGLPAKITTDQSDGTTLEQEFTYPHNLNTSVAQAMLAKNDLARPMEERYSITKDGSVLSDKKIIYSYGSATCGKLPYRLNALQESVADGSTVRNVESYNSYDAQGNLTEYTRQDGTVVSLVWGYNYQKLVAEVVGVPFSTVSSKINYTSIQSMTGSALQNALDALRSGTTGLVTTYTWYPSRGVASVTDPSGITTTYSYDGFGRLTKVVDAEGNTLDSYTYHISQ